MPLTVNLPGGRSIVLDESTGNIVGESADQAYSGPEPDVSGTLPPAPGGGDEFDPNTDRVTDVLSLPGGKQITYIKNGQIKTTFIPNETSGGGGGGVSASTVYSQQQQNARDAAGLAEEQRQYNESFGFNKAKYNTDFAEGKRQFDQQFGLEQDKLAKSRGDTLLSLGSRPDTLTKYLYALGGQQTPQGLQNTTANLPGYQNVIGRTNYGASSPVAPVQTAQPAAAPAQNLAPTVTAAAPGQTFANIPSNANVAQVNGTPISLANGFTADKLAAGLKASSPTTTSSPAPVPSLSQPAPALPGASATSTGYASPYQGLSGFNTDGTLRLAANDPDAASLMAKYPGRYRVGFASGGVIPEPVDGIGRVSGQAYEFGEKGPEAVVPNNVFERLMKDAGEVEYSEDDGKSKKRVKVNRYASGGPIGYQASDLFNPPDLSSIINRGFNSDPSVPLFPQVNTLTGGGASLIPSAQKLNQATPTEQGLYAGFLQDEAGVVPEDVFSMSQRLAPKVRGLSTPRYV